MDYIKKPDGVDFVINGKPLTKEEQQAISEFIKADKERLAGMVKNKTHFPEKPEQAKEVFKTAKLPPNENPR